MDQMDSSGRIEDCRPTVLADAPDGEFSQWATTSDGTFDRGTVGTGDKHKARYSQAAAADRIAEWRTVGDGVVQE